MYSVLYVDDEPDLLEIGKIYLELSDGISVDTAPSAQKALEKMAVQSFDIIVSDYQMPEMDGLKFLSLVRKEKPHLPFIIFTGRGREEVAIEAFEKGADFYLQKGGEPKAQFAELVGKIQIAVDRRRAEERVISLNRFYSMLSATNRAIIRFREKKALLAGICRVIVEIGEFRLAWAGIADPEKKKINLVASSGDTGGFLDDIAISVEDSPRTGPTGTAYRTGTIAVSNDIATDARMEPVREKALKSGYKALAAFPFGQLTGDSGVLTIYAGQTDFFNDQILLLLKEMSEDITFALMTITDEERRKAAERDLRRTNDELNAAYEQMTATDEELRANYDELETGQRSLVESEMRYRHLIEAVTDYIFTVRVEAGKAVETQHGPGCEAVTGYTSDDFAADTSLWIRMVAEEDRAAVVRQAEEVLSGKHAPPLEHRIIRKDGALRWVRNTPVPYSDDKGRIVAYDGIIQDITERRKAEETMQDSEMRFRTMVEQSPQSIQIMSPDGRTVQVNHAFELLWGVTIEDLKNYNVLTDPQLDTLGIKPYILRGFAGESVSLPAAWYDVRTTLGSGEKRWVVSRIYPVRDGTGTIRNVVLMHEDITDRRRAEDALGEREKTLAINEKRLRMAQEIGHTGSWEYDLRTRRIWGSAEGLHMFGYPPVAKYIPIEDIESRIPGRERVHEALVDMITRGSDYDLEYRIIPADGSPPREIHSIAQLERDADGTILRIVGVVQDITDRKRAEEEIRNSESRYRTIFSQAAEGILVADAASKHLLHANPAICRMLGYSEEELTGLRLEDIHPEKDREFVVAEFHALISGDRKSTTEIPCRRKDGTHFYADIAASVAVIDGRECLVGFFVDVTERRKAQLALRQTNRQLSLLARITRHDILNNVTVILGYTGVAKDQCTESPAQGYFDKIESATRAIRAQIEFTRIYQDLGTRDPQWQDLDSVIRKIQVPSTVTLDKSFGRVEIFADLMLERVMDNLIDNSLRHGGKVTLIRVTVSPGPAGLVIVYEDNGKGIPKAEKGKIFDHGFGKNSGLGLFLVREILSITGITIRENGREGEGARFEITVPKGEYRQFPP
jgi:PAS domain S-box-containing protein